MGLDRTIQFPQPEPPAWDAVRAQLARVGETAPLRMIDGLPAFPDETPDPGWKELRVGTAAGMITLRRSAGAITCVIWGNADDVLKAAWDRLCWACAAAGAGVVETPTGPLTAEEFARSVGIPPS